MQSSDLQNAVAILRTGGIIAYPTEAVFGLGCDPRNESALHKLLSLKNRKEGKGLIIIAASYRQLEPFVAPDTFVDFNKLTITIEPPTTWIVSANKTCSSLLTGGRPTLAVRITQHALAAELCEKFGGAITSTSANLSGHSPAYSLEAVRVQFPHGIDHFVSGEVGGLSAPTRIIDFKSGEVLRSQ